MELDNVTHEVNEEANVSETPQQTKQDNQKSQSILNLVRLVANLIAICLSTRVAFCRNTFQTSQLTSTS